MRRIVAALFNGHTRPDSNPQAFEAECPGCGHSNPGQSKFCNICGARLQIICPHCNLPNPITAATCVHCQTELPHAHRKTHPRAESRKGPEAAAPASSAARPRTPVAHLSHAEFPPPPHEQRVDATAWERAHPGFVVTGVVMAALAVPTLYLYREYSVLDVPHATGPGKVISIPAPATGVTRDSEDVRSSAASRSAPATVPDTTTTERSADIDRSAAVNGDRVEPGKA